jgi:protein SCO1/2
MFNWDALTKWTKLGAWAGLLALSLQAGANSPSNMTSDEKPRELEGIGITEQLGTTLNLDEMVRNEKGESVPLRSFFGGHKPVILSFVYFSCPGLCNFHLNGLTETLKQVDWSVGEKFDVVALSFDSKEKPDLAAGKKDSYVKMYDRAGTENGWHFVTADEAAIQRLTSQAGFKFKWDEEQKQWAHASAAILVTPEGKIARYLHGIMFDAPTVKMALNEAGEGRVGSFVDKMIWYCFHYDPRQSKYTLYAFRLVQLAGGLMVLLLGLLLIPHWLRARRQSA